jgi:hypothetical protein
VSPAVDIHFDADSSISQQQQNGGIGFNIDDLASLPFEMPKLQRKLEQLKRHSWNEGDATLPIPHLNHLPTVRNVDHDADVNLSTSDRAYFPGNRSDARDYVVGLTNHQTLQHVPRNLLFLDNSQI